MWHFPLAQSGGWDGDEVMLLVVCSLATVSALWSFGRSLWAVPEFGRRPPVELTLLAAVVASFATLTAVTWFWTAVEIREGQDYMWLALAMGGAWFFLYVRLFRWLGIDLRDDACERANPAAAVALCGAIPGGMLLYCGSVCGEGPSFWNNVFTVFVAGLTWFLCWFLLETPAALSHAVAEERDVGAGLRLAGFLMAEGLVLGRAAAGNWSSVEATVVDLARLGWPALVGTGAAVGLEKLVLSVTSPTAPSSRGLSALIAGIYLLLAGLWVGHLGPWEGMPR